MFHAGSASCKECTPSPSDSPTGGWSSEEVRAFTPSYPMFVIPVATLLNMDLLTPHHQLLDSGLLVPWTDDMRGKVLGVSHQWLGYTEPDPRGEHLDCLKRFLTRLARGEIKRVENLWLWAARFQTFAIASKHLRMALPEMYVWIDYCCMPQVRPGCSVASMRQAASAVISLPAYIERFSMLLVLAPVVTHTNTGETCNYSTWRQRGWCRLELLSALLAPRDIHVLVCTGPEATPFLMHPIEGPRLLPSTGRFTCCDLGHHFGFSKMECDKGKIREVLRNLIDSKVFMLKMQRRHMEQTYWASLRDYFLSGLPRPSKDGKSVVSPLVHKKLKKLLIAKRKELKSAEETGDCVEILKAKLGWSEEHERSAAKSGLSLLHCACLANNAAAVRRLSAEAGQNIDGRLRHNWYHLAYMFKGVTPLHAAMNFANGDCVRAVLEARATPNKKTSCNLTALMTAVCKGNVRNVKVFLEHFPGYDLEQKGYLFPMTPGMVASCCSPEKFEVLKALVSARANVCDAMANETGGALLTFAALSEDCDTASMRLLLAHGADVNARLELSQIGCRAWKPGMRVVRALEPWTGSRVLATLAVPEGATALHGAAMRGDVALVKLLVEARAEALRNKQGRTPLDVAKTFFGEVPPALEACLLGARGSSAPCGEAVEAPRLLDTLMQRRQHNPSVAVNKADKSKVDIVDAACDDVIAI